MKRISLKLEGEKQNLFEEPEFEFSKNVVKDEEEIDIKKKQVRNFIVNHFEKEVTIQWERLDDESKQEIKEYNKKDVL